MEIYCLTEEEQAQCKDNFPMVDNARLEEKYAEAQELESLESAIRKNALSGEESRRLEELSGYFAEGMPMVAVMTIAVIVYSRLRMSKTDKAHLSSS